MSYAYPIPCMTKILNKTTTWCKQKQFSKRFIKISPVQNYCLLINNGIDIVSLGASFEEIST